MAEEEPTRVSPLDGEAPKSDDFANYFCTYAFLYHQVSKCGREGARGWHQRQITATSRLNISAERDA